MYEENMMELITAIAITAAKDYLTAVRYLDSHDGCGGYVNQMKSQKSQIEWFLGEDVCEEIRRNDCAGYYTHGGRF